MALLDTPVVIDMLVKASVVLGATALVAAALRRASAAARHLVWTLGLVGALAAPALTLVLPRWEVPIVEIARDVPAAPASAEDALGRRTAAPRPSVAEEPQQAAAHSRVRSTSTASETALVPRAAWVAALAGRLGALSWPVLLFLAWAVGAAAILARMLMGHAAVQWMSRRTPVIDAAPWLAEAQSLARGLGIRRVRFLRSRAGSMPMAWGVFRQSVLMPVDADGWPADRLRFVLLHELAHVKRRDCLTHLVAQLASAAYWFNPLAWMAVKRLRTERERACDDLVLSSGTRGPDYADQLLEIARVMRAGRFPAVLAGATLAMAHRSQLEGRLIAILDPRVPRRGVTRGRAAVATAAFALALVPLASVQPWANEAATTIELLPANVPPAIGAAPRPQPAAPPAPPLAPASQGRANHSPDRDASPQTIAQSVTQGIAEGVAQGTAQTVADGVTQGVVEGVTQSVLPVVPEIVGAALEHAMPFAHAAVQDAKKSGAADPRTIAALAAALKDSDKDVRETALHALVQLRDPSVFEPLLTALKDASADVREHAAFGLGQMRDRRAVEPLTAALKDADADVRQQVVFALGQLRDPSTIDPLATALHDGSADVREQAAFALGQLRDRRAVEPLVSALKDEKPDVREQAAFALGQLRDPKAVEALVIALKDANADVREQAAFALGQLRDPRAIDGLTSALKDANASVRQQAAFALGQIR